jgi:hypothetical protein
LIDTTETNVLSLLTPRRRQTSVRATVFGGKVARSTGRATAHLPNAKFARLDLALTLATRINVEWIDSGREPQNPPNPAYPNGIDLDLSAGAKVACLSDLPYPAKRCGVFVLKCETCGQTAAITTAGRVDDPRSAKLGCRLSDPLKSH